MSSAQVHRPASLMVATCVVGATLINVHCFAQETAPQTTKSQEGQANPKPEKPSEDSAPAKSKEPQMIDGVYRVGNGVTPPKLTHSVEPKFSAEAKRKKVQGVCVVALVIDEKGMPQDVHVIKPIGAGLDENAVDAVKQYRFKPATYRGEPVPVLISIIVTYRINY